VARATRRGRRAHPARATAIPRAAAAHDSTSVEWLAGARRRPDPAAMRLLRIAPVSLDVPDRPRSIAWYQDVLGLQGGGGRPGPPGEPVFLGPAAARVALFEAPAPALRHIALATDAAGQQLVRERLDRLAVPCRAERHRDHDSLYFRDPDGITLEVMVPTA
jgi:catechol 2,3-dioxygenase-like lactoylglutathione lyase family enzyme